MGFGIGALNVGVFFMARQTQGSQAMSLTTEAHQAADRQAADHQAEAHEARDRQMDHDPNVAKSVSIERRPPWTGLPIKNSTTLSTCTACTSDGLHVLGHIQHATMVPVPVC